MQGTLDIIRIPPHFIRFLFLLSLEEGIDNLTLGRRIHSSVIIRKMSKDEKAGVYTLDYIVPLHTIADTSAYLIDDMLSIEQCLPGQKPLILENIRLSLTQQDRKFLCAHRIHLDIHEYDDPAITEYRTTTRTDDISPEA